MTISLDSWHRLLFEHSMDGIFLTRPDGAVLAANPAACAILGYSQDEICQRGRAGIVDTRDPRLAGALAQRAQNGAFRGILNFVRQDGTIIPVELASIEFRNSDGQILRSVTFRDVSAQQRAEQALLDSEERYRTAFLTSPDAITITELPQGRYQDINEGFTHTFGWTRDEVIGRTSSEIGIWQNAQDRQRFIDQIESRGQCINFETTFLTRERRPLTALVSSRIVTVSGQRSILTVTRDISQRKQAETELELHRLHLQDLVEARTQDLVLARDAAQAATIAKSAFLANMSHEIRTPMNAIVGFAHLLKRSPLTPEQRARLDKLCQASEHLRTLIDDILDLSKIEAGKLVLECVDVQPRALLDEACALIGEQARAKGLRLDLDTASVPDRLRGDPTRLRQALLNLAGNAVKFTRSGTISLRAQVLRDEADRVLVRFEVRDSGIGIAPDKLGELFQPFHQVDASMTRLYGGTGLGLAITSRLAGLMGGEAGAQSIEGVGSTFWFSAWLQRESPARADRPAPAEPARAVEATQAHAHPGARILLAEDNPVNQEVAVLLLTSAGLVVEVAEDGHQAVAMASRGYDLILMDMQMPGMDGLEATRTIRTLPGQQHTPIVAMTANAFHEDRQRCLAAGMNDFIAKPVDPETLFGIVSKWLDQADASAPR
ncbi:MAG: PAS domain S-box protein [Leptothrix sp. (in: b-proteobacteria)]